MSAGIALCLTMLFSAACEQSYAEDPPASTTTAAAATKDKPTDPAAQAPVVPDDILEGGAGWLNTDRPISMQELRGKVVLFDFWTYCCINCMHVLPDLKHLEEKYPNELVVIGVHSAKFDNEKDSDAIRQAILRYGIQHPVVNDNQMTIWRKFGVRAWPTLALVDPQGRFLGSRGGEGNLKLFDTVIADIIRYHRAAGTLKEEPLHFELESGKVASTPLRFPGKLLADEDSDRLFISDTSHNRVVVCGLDGRVQQVIGDGHAGHRDGSFEQAQFDHPQGLCLVGSLLYVADTENHLIRTVDLQSGQVSTLAGTGQQGRPRTPTSTLRETALNSPWDLCFAQDTLFIAMAGPHQIWSHVPGTDTIDVYAGSAREDVVNGLLSEAAFAQPSGLAVSADGKRLFVADSEGSAIRQVSVDGQGSVSTLAGTSELPRGRSLFAFGDVDGTGAEARFQHPIGVARYQEQLLVADSYNHKIRGLDPTTGEVTTLLGDGHAGPADSLTQLNEPAGLSVAGDRLYIADTNNHRICVMNLTSKSLSVLPLDGLSAPVPEASP